MRGLLALLVCRVRGHLPGVRGTSYVLEVTVCPRCRAITGVPAGGYTVVYRWAQVNRAMRGDD